MRLLENTLQEKNQVIIEVNENFLIKIKHILHIKKGMAGYGRNILLSFHCIAGTP